MKLHAQSSYDLTSPDGVKIHVNEYGNGKPVLLLAGGPGLNANYLRPIWENTKGFRFIVPDQRGTGLSKLNVIDSAHLTVEKFVADLEALRIHLGLSKMIIAGHSWGGMLAFAYAAKHPDHVERLVLLDPGGITAKFEQYFDSNIHMRMYPEERDAEKRATPGSLEEAQAEWSGYFFNRQRALETRHLMDSTIFSAASGELEGIVLQNYNATESIRVNGLSHYMGPVTLIQGRQDPVGESTAFETRELLPQTNIQFIEDCGHMPWLEDTAERTKFYKLLNEAMTEQSKPEIAAINQVFVTRLASGDAAGVSKCYTQDAVFMGTNMPMAVGRGAIAGIYGHLVQAGLTHMTFTTVSVWNAGELLAEQGVYTLETAKGQNKDTGKYIVFWKKEEGQWRIFRDIFNSDMPAGK